MKRRIKLSITLLLIVAAMSLLSFDTRVAAQNQIRVVGDTGIVSLGLNQKLRLFVFDDTDGAESVSFRQIGYTQGVCNGGVCKSSVSSQSQTAPVVMGQGEAFQLEIAGLEAGFVRAVVLSNRSTVKVNAMIVDGATGQVVSLLCQALCRNES